MKRLLLLYFVSMFSLLSISAQDIEINGLIYRLRGNEADVAGYTSIPSNGKVVIPEQVHIDGISYPVTGISSSAFHPGLSECLDLRAIEIPKSVNRIGGGAFYGCRYLSDVKIGNYDDLWLGNDVFRGCWSLPVINHVVYAGKIAVVTDDSPQGRWDNSRPNRSEYKIRRGTKIIGGFAFHCCENMKQVNIPSSVVTICPGAFRGCTSLTEVKIPNGVKTIGHWAFSCCYSLKSVSLPKSVGSIGEFFGIAEEYNTLEPYSPAKAGTALIDNNVFEMSDSLVEVTVR